MLVLKKGSFKTVPISEMPVPRGRRRTASTPLEDRTVKNPGSRGGRWFFNRNHQIEYGDPPVGHTGYHSGEHHEMFGKFAKHHYQKQALADAHDESVNWEANPVEHATTALRAAYKSHFEEIDNARVDHNLYPGDKFKKKYHDKIDLMGKMLTAVHAGGKKHGFDKDYNFATQYRHARRLHAIALIEADRLQLDLPTTEELKALPVPKTIEEAKNLGSKYLPHVHFDISEMDLEVADTMIYQLLTVAKDYDQGVIKALRDFGSRRSNGVFQDLRGFDWDAEPGTYAHMTHSGHAMGINPEYSGSIAMFRDRLEEDRTNKWLVSGKLEDIVTHEFGHAVDFYYSSHPNWGSVLEAWKESHMYDDPVSKYAEYDDDALKKTREMFWITGKKEKGYREEWQRYEQWAESFVIQHQDQLEGQPDHSIQMKRLFQFLHENPTFDIYKDEISEDTLRHIGIDKFVWGRRARVPDPTDL